MNYEYESCWSAYRLVRHVINYEYASRTVDKSQTMYTSLVAEHTYMCDESSTMYMRQQLCIWVSHELWMSHELCVRVNFSFQQPQPTRQSLESSTMYMRHELCIWVSHEVWIELIYRYIYEKYIWIVQCAINHVYAPRTVDKSRTMYISLAAAHTSMCDETSTIYTRRHRIAPCIVAEIE